MIITSIYTFDFIDFSQTTYMFSEQNDFSKFKLNLLISNFEEDLFKGSKHGTTNKRKTYCFLIILRSSSSSFMIQNEISSVKHLKKFESSRLAVIFMKLLEFAQTAITGG